MLIVPEESESTMVGGGVAGSDIYVLHDHQVILGTLELIFKA